MVICLLKIAKNIKYLNMINTFQLKRVKNASDKNLLKIEIC